MVFVSFAPNFEDVMLWRALGSVGLGFYVDIGASDPDERSVTRAFYERGWNGLNITPLPATAARLQASRLRDTTLNLAVGAVVGDALLQIADEPGLATLDDAEADALRAQGLATQLVPVRLHRLDALLDQHAPATIHFLRIDAAGGEAQVLRGADFQRHRPWILLVRSIAPISHIQGHADWEPSLLAAGYRFAWFDGISRHYLAEEQAAALAPHFTAPPNALDDFVSAGDAALAARLRGAETRVAMLTDQARIAEARAREDLRALIEMRVLSDHRGHEIAVKDRAAAAERAAFAERTAEIERRAAAERAALAERVAEIECRAAAERAAFAERAAEIERRAVYAEGWLAAVRRSTSWQMTRPFRVLLRKLGRGSAPAEPRPAAHPVESSPAPLEFRPAAHLFESSPTPFEPRPVVHPVESSPVPAAVAGPAMTLQLPQADRPGFPHAASPPTWIIHQFHPGSARGDAVTNAMLLIRGLLRGLGYISEIFCEQPDPSFGRELRPMDELPRHDGYVLLQHFSLGFPKLPEILALPAAKVLLYHNITPPDLLVGAPGLQDLARLGYDQLADFRPHVSAALAVSEYNALALRALGFPDVRACPLLFDVQALRADAGTILLPRTDPAFTVLFVGRLVASKAQDDLVEAFALFHDAFPRPSRLVLVGRGQSGGDDFLHRLEDRIAALGLADSVVFTGFVDDAGLRQAYHEADLYVSLSHHEGFGVPLVEAVAHGVPVLAWPCGAVPYTLSDPEELLDDRTPAAVAARMLALADNEAERQALVRRQMRRLDRFRLDRHLPTLLHALGRAGAALPEAAQTRALLRANMHFVVTGHINGSYSLAAINRGLALSIEAARPGRVRVVPVEGRETQDISGVPAHQATGIADLVARAPAATGPLVVIGQHYPLHVPADPGDLSLALFFWEESLIPAETVRSLNRMFHGVLAPSTFVAKVLVDSGVHVPVHQVGQSPDLAAFRALGAERRLAVAAARPVLSFLHVSSCFPRKGVDILLAAYIRAFRRGDPVRLVIKGFPNPHNDVEDRVARIRADDPLAPEIVLINHDLDRQEFLDLYREADVMVLPTRGEGFNLPAAEAMAARLPLIVTGFGGQADFCTASTARLLRWRHAPSATHLASGNSLWVEPSEDDLVAALGEAQAVWTGQDAAKHAESAARVRAAAALIDSTMDDGALIRRIEAAALDCMMTPPPRPPRMVWISSWEVPCGVAGYTSQLLAAWPDDGAVASHMVLADTRTEIGCTAASDISPRVRIAWRLGEPISVATLREVIAQEDPDLLVIQHQPGLLSWPLLERILHAEQQLEQRDQKSAAGRAIVVTLHNTLHLAAIRPEERLSVLDRLARVGRVIVHTVADLDRLAAFGLSGNVVMMPHGVPAIPAEAPRPVRRLAPDGSPDGSPVLGCYGFFLPDKGIEQLIAAVALLRPAWPGLRLKLINAAYGTEESAAEIQRCRDAAAAAGMSDAVEFHTDFLPEAQSRDLLAACDLVVLPYQRSQEASSAALRSVLAAGVPVAVTPLAVFDDAAPAVFRLDGTGPEAIAAGAHGLLIEDDQRAALLASAAAWMAAQTWPVIAERMQGLLLGVLQERRIWMEQIRIHNE